MIKVQETNGYHDLKNAIKFAQEIEYSRENSKKFTRRWNKAEKIFNRIKPMLIKNRMISDAYDFTGFVDQFMCGDHRN